MMRQISNSDYIAASTHLRSTCRTIISAYLHPLVNALLVEAVSTRQDTEILLRLIILETNKALRYHGQNHEGPERSNRAYAVGAIRRDLSRGLVFS